MDNGMVYCLQLVYRTPHSRHQEVSKHNSGIEIAMGLENDLIPHYEGRVRLNGDNLERHSCRSAPAR
jgi:hypothetical protein